MKIKEVYDFLDSFAPFKNQLDFDNAGFLIGDVNAEVKGIVVTLDITDEVIKFAINKNANLIITHHPVIFEPLKSVLSDSLVFSLIKNDINVISAHTNLDMAQGGVNDKLCEIIGLENIEGVFQNGEVYEARIGTISETDADTFAKYLKEKLGGMIKYTKGADKIKTVGICSGSGGSMLYDMAKLGVDAFVTADIKHNILLDAEHLNIAIFDCGHFNTEDIIVSPIKNKLEEKFHMPTFEFHSDIIKSI